MEEIASKLKKTKNQLSLSFDDKIASDYKEDPISKSFKKRKINKPTNVIGENTSGPKLISSVPSGVIISLEDDNDDESKILERSIEKKMLLK